MEYIYIYENFLNLSKQDDISFEPKSNEEFLGMHALLMIGFNEDTQTIDVLNSHGESFAYLGYFRISYKYILNQDLSFDFYVLNSE